MPRTHINFPVICADCKATETCVCALSDNNLFTNMTTTKTAEEIAAENNDMKFKSEVVALLNAKEIDDAAFKRTMLSFLAYFIPVKDDVKSLKTQMDSIKLKTDENVSQIATLTSEIKGYKDEVSQLRNELATAKRDFYINRESIIAEINDRNKRSKNLLLFNIPEASPQLSADEAGKTDFDLVKNLLSAFYNDKVQLKTDLNNIRVHRIGNVNTSKIRPICVKLEYEDDVFKVIMNRKLVQDYKINTDRRTQQREHLKFLNDEKNKHNASYPNEPLTIKYKNQVPIFVKKTTSEYIQNSRKLKSNFLLFL